MLKFETHLLKCGYGAHYSLFRKLRDPSRIVSDISTNIQTAEDLIFLMKNMSRNKADIKILS